MENGARPRQIIWRTAKPPHRGVSGGGGDGSRSHGLKLNNNFNLMYIIARMMAATRTVGPNRIAIVGPFRSNRILVRNAHWREEATGLVVAEL